MDVIRSLVAVTHIILVGIVPSVSAPSLSTGSLPDTRSHAECLDYAARVMRVLAIEQIKVTQMSVYGTTPDFNFVIRCETKSRTVFFAAAGGDDGAKVEGLLQVLMRQFEITKDLPRCNSGSSSLQLCQ